MALVDRKREEFGLDALKVFDRTAYMRELMAKRRERQKRIVTIANTLRSERDKLVGQARVDFMNDHANRWHAVRLEREEEERKRLGRRLTEVERQEVIAKLWQDVDAELDAYEDYAKSWEVFGDVGPAGFEFKLQPKEKK